MAASLKKFAGWWSKMWPTATVDHKPDTISNDELVTAYEVLTFGGQSNILPLEKELRFGALAGYPEPVLATLRKLGAQ